MGFYTKDSSPVACVPTCAPESAPPRLDFVGSGYRSYNSAIGRWLSRDPIEEFGGNNLYRYVRNTPLILWDDLGMKEEGPGTTECKCPPKENYILDAAFPPHHDSSNKLVCTYKHKTTGKVYTETIDCGHPKPKPPTPWWPLPNPFEKKPKPEPEPARPLLCNEKDCKVWNYSKEDTDANSHRGGQAGKDGKDQPAIMKDYYCGCAYVCATHGDTILPPQIRWKKVGLSFSNKCKELCP